MSTARRHFKKKGQAAGFARQKSTEGFNTGALILPIRGEREWVILWSAGFLNPARSKRA
jgi:hypothetical protein